MAGETVESVVACQSSPVPSESTANSVSSTTTKTTPSESMAGELRIAVVVETC